MSKLVVHAGDFAKGAGSITGGLMFMPPEKWWQQWGHKIPLGDIAEVEAASEESVKRIGGTVGWGAAGAVVLGPIGLLAGLLLGGRGKETTFVCKLKDGRKFLATTDTKGYTKLLAATFPAAEPA